MHNVFLLTVLCLHVGYSLSHTSLDSSQKYGSHNLLKLQRSNNSSQRPVRCTPCEDAGFKKPISNHLDRDYRGNGADNLGYDWSSMAWGGLAYPRRSKLYMDAMPGREGRMMPSDWGRKQENVRVVCDTCRVYWDGNAGGARGDAGRGGGGGRPYGERGGRNFYGGQPDYWQGDKTGQPGGYEARVMSPTVGVLVKPGSRIAYIPSRSGEMFWDGVSGGGTRWDGFSNGISWVGANAPEWDRSDSEPRDEKPGYASGPSRPGGDYPYGSSGFGNRDDMKRPWADGMGRGYYFTNGVPNDIDPQWRDRGYASNWHYGSTNQNGWNGNNMKWNYGGKQWPDNDRAANRFYFNTAQDRNYVPIDGRHQQYGNQYPNYQSGGGYPQNFRPQPSWPPRRGYRPNDRFPASFPQESLGSGDQDKPWDYSSGDLQGLRRPGPRPEWIRPGPSYPMPTNFEGSSGRFPNNYGGYNKFSPSDRNDYDKPWNRPSGYGPAKPGAGGDGFPYGGNLYPEEGGGRPDFSVGGGHLFIPNGDNRQPSYPNGASGDNRPTYPSGNRKPGDYSGNRPGTLGHGGRPYTDDRRPSIIYTGGRPSGGESSSGGYPGGSGSSSGGYPGGSGSSSGGYPGGSGSSSGGYPGGSGSSSGGYPGGGGSSSGGYPSGGGSLSGGHPSSGSTSGYPSSESSVGGSGGYPGGIRPGPAYPAPSSGYPGGENPYSSGLSRPGGYPAGGRPGNYISSGGRPGSYGGSPGGFPGGDGSSFSRPSVYPASGGSSYPGGNIRPGSYPDEGYSQPGYFGSSQPSGYPSTGRPGGYPGEGGRPDEYPGGGRPGYPIRGQSPYPGQGSGGPSGVYQQGGKAPPKGYYTGYITELTPDDGQGQYGGKNPNYFGSSYPGNSYPGKDRDKYYYGGNYSNRPPSGDKNRYPAYSEDRYSGGGGSGYPAGDKDSGYDRGSDKFYYGQSGGKGKYPDGYPSNHRLPGGLSGGDFDRNQSSGDDKNSWNYGQSERKDGIYRRSGGSYPPYRGGQYYTSSYLASMPTTSGSTQAGTETKTQTVTKADEVTQSTLDSS